MVLAMGESSSNTEFACNKNGCIKHTHIHTHTHSGLTSDTVLFLQAGESRQDVSFFVSLSVSLLHAHMKRCYYT